MSTPNFGDLPVISVDAVVLRYHEGTLQVATIKRTEEPFKGQLTLPGALLRMEETPSQAATAAVAGKAGLPNATLAGTAFTPMASPDRDPRHRAVALPALLTVPQGTDSNLVVWVALGNIAYSTLGFDHEDIVTSVTQAAAARLFSEGVSLLPQLLGEQFTTADARKVAVQLSGKSVDSGNFNRQLRTVADKVEVTGHSRKGGTIWQMKSPELPA